MIYQPVGVGQSITAVAVYLDQTSSERVQGFIRTAVASVFDLATRPGFRWRADGRFLLAEGVEAACRLSEHAQDRFFEDEGVTWIRGWPPFNDPAVEALLAAYALGADEGALPLLAFTENTSPWYTETWKYDEYLEDNFEARGLVR